ncbi:MAG TPA: alpha/beta hydrolase [Burkholderiales bacterium]|nr:alpha/beta hydrolase [Burkholderiales bacterium]
MTYYDWGDPANPRVVVCVHGLTRNGRDFDFLAQALGADFRVICPDIVGRGSSDWLEAKGDYGYVQYAADMTALIARVTDSGERQVSWVGTSMGGLLGIVLAATPRNPIARLVVNDAGMLVPRAALERLALYVGKEPRFPDYDALEAHVRRVSAPFGPLTDEQWRHLTVHSAREHPDGTWTLRYDPAIAHAFSGDLADIDLSRYWNAVACPTLLLRGAASDILLPETAAAMTRCGPRPQLVEFPGIGHAPMLMCGEQVEVVREFLHAA